MTLDPKDLQREIEATLAELEEIEADVMEFFADLGPDIAQRIAAYKAARAQEPQLEKLKQEAKSEPSTERPETR